MTSLAEEDGSSKARKGITNDDLRWWSRCGRSALPKRIGKKKLLRFGRQFHTSSWRMSKAPRVQLLYYDDRLCCEERIRLCAETALSSWNEKSSSEQGPEYELVEQPISALQCRRRMLYHCNFTARPKLASEAENKLFFAELKSFRSPVKYGEYDFRCLFCCILGPNGCETGIDCNFCDMYPDRVQHPEGGFTEVERSDDESWPPF